MHNKKKKRLRLGITMGDVNGVGPELVIRAFSIAKMREMIIPVVYGSSRVINIFRKVMNIEKFNYHVVQEPKQARPNNVSIIDVVEELGRVDIGKPSKVGGEVAFKALEAATRDLKAGEIDALVTLPIDKNTMQSEEFKFPGHTEYLASTFEVKDNLMLMIDEDLRIGVVTGHVPLKAVSENLTVDGIVSKIKLMNSSLQKDFSIDRPKIAVLGLNPHAGDNGLLGKEDKEKIKRAVERVAKDKIFALGPYPADGFFGSGAYAQFDGVLAMYHDQGLIPFKLMSGFRGVNYTAGLPVIRTSPDHGVAYDIAGSGKADITSFLHAIYAAIDIHHSREQSDGLAENAMEKKDSRQVMREMKKQKSSSRRPNRESRDGGRDNNRNNQKTAPRAENKTKEAPGKEAAPAKSEEE